MRPELESCHDKHIDGVLSEVPVHIDLTMDDEHDAVRMAEYSLADARTAATAGQAEEARAALEPVLEYGSHLQIAWARVQLAFLDHADGDEKNAELLLREADKIAESTESLEFVFDLAAAWREIGHPRCATRAYHRALDVLGAPRHFSLDDEPDGAEPALSGAERFSVAYAYFRLGELALEGDQTNDRLAASYFEGAGALNDPDVSPFALLQLADSEKLWPQAPQRAEKLYLDALAFDHPEASPEAGFQLGRLLAESGQISHARTRLRWVAEESGHSEWAARASKLLAQLPGPIDGDADDLWEVPEPHLDRAVVSGSLPGERTVLIVGAGTGGQYLHRCLQAPIMRHRYHVIGFVDDGKYPDGNVPTVADKKVLGPVSTLPRLIEHYAPHVIWLAMPTASPLKKRDVAFACADASVPLRTLPNMHELRRETDLLPQLRDVRLDDIYGVDAPVRVNHDATAWIRARSVMIVGCGAIGSQLARRIADAGADRIVLVDREDGNLEELEEELRRGRFFRGVHTRHGTAVAGKDLVNVAAEHECDLVVYAASSGWANAERGVSRLRRRLAGVLDLVQALPRAGSVERFIWVSDANAALPNTPARATAAIAEALALNSTTAGDSIVRCAVRVPRLYTSRRSVVGQLQHQAHLGIPLRVPPPPASQRLAHAYEAAERLLQIAWEARPREAYAFDGGIEISLWELAETMLRLRGMAHQQENFIHPTDAPTQVEAPRPSGTSTPVRDVLALGCPGGDPDLLAKVRAVLRKNGDLVTFARNLPRLDTSARPVEALASVTDR
jgi:nucleoside-diphosphate-sugar epimerase